jgi:predicted dehydrogenase
VSLDRVRLLRAGYALKDLTSVAYWRNKLTDAGPERSYWNALEAFAAAAASGECVEPDLGAGYRTLEMIDAAERSAREGRRIEIEAAPS